MVRNRAAEVLIGGLSDPFSSAISSVSKGLRHIAEDKRYAAELEQSRIVIQAAQLAFNVRSRHEKLNQAIGTYDAFPKKQPLPQVPGYYTSVDRPITEIGALASMVDKIIKPRTDGSARRALIVAQDPFRGSLQQQELHKYGFETKIVPPGIDPQIAEREFGGRCYSWN